MIPLVVSPAIRDKLLDRHGVQELEVVECFLNDDVGKYIEDDREDHRTDPPTLWFVGETHRGRRLKVIFVNRDGNLYLKSAYDANDSVIRTYTELTNTGD